MYGKIHASLWAGTLGRRFPDWAVFVFMVVHAGPDGVFEMAPEQIAARTGMHLPDVEQALKRLGAEDERSRSAEEGGRRILLVGESGWCWQIVNHARYRSLRDMDEVRHQTRERVRKYRERKRLEDVTPGNAEKRHTEDRSQKTDTEKTPPVVPPVGDVSDSLTGKRPGRKRSARLEGESEGFAAFWAVYPRRVGRRAAAKAFAAALSRHGTGEDPWQAEHLRQAAEQFAGKVAGTDPKFVPHPTTWLNQDRFLEEAEG